MSAPVLFSARNHLKLAITKNKFVHCHIVKERLRTETDKIHNSFENRKVVLRNEIIVILLFYTVYKWLHK